MHTNHSGNMFNTLQTFFGANGKKSTYKRFSCVKKWVNSRRNIRKGDVVLLNDSSVHRNQWPMGLVTETFKGEDDLVRQVSVKTVRNGKTSFLQRPVTELIVLLESEV